MTKQNVLQPPLPKTATKTFWTNLIGASQSLAIAQLAKEATQPIVIFTPDMASVFQIEQELQFFLGEADNIPILLFPDWEILPYDRFSPHQDIISQRLRTLNELIHLERGILLAPITTLLHRLLPREYLEGNVFIFKTGDTIHPEALRQRLVKSGYHQVSQVMEHGEYAVRGSLIDIFPMGSDEPIRLDLFDQTIESIRTFDPETQRTINTLTQIELLPAHEYPLDEEAIKFFRQAWRDEFSGNPLHCPVYEQISQGESAAGIEYYLPLFHPKTSSIFDYLPNNVILIRFGDLTIKANDFWQEVNNRYEQLAHDVTRPILSPQKILLPIADFFANLNLFTQIEIVTTEKTAKDYDIEFNSLPIPDIGIENKANEPLKKLVSWLEANSYRLLFCAETAGRQEVLLDLLRDLPNQPKKCASWQNFIKEDQLCAITIGNLERSALLTEPNIFLISEATLLGQPVLQRRFRKKRESDPEQIIRDLSEIKIGTPVVHIDHGIGRYLGLQTISTGDFESEYLTLEYAENTKIYVPVSSLHLISRYSGVDIEHAPLTRLGTTQWERAKRKAAEKVHDVAAELLEIYAKRMSKPGFAFKQADHLYTAFAASFPFEETPDQLQTIEQVFNDMTSNRCMDRLICGDVGFGKTEVAVRAAFLAVQSNKQVALLVPTTLLAEQHLNTFRDRFANWPVQVEAISRFRSKTEQQQIIENIANGKIDIIIGTHKLLQSDIKFKDLGLLIIDEEHRFGVKQKERIKALRAEVDMLAMTATPIPRTLNLSLNHIRDLSIIATPPAKRLSVKTFVRENDNTLIREAVLREILRGGQVYYLYNEVQSIEKIANDLQTLIPEAKVSFAHGQMRETELERIVRDFYHGRFNLLVSTTIIESGIDIPNANTIIIHRADRLGLAQLHQLRGRVGRSHHQAYAYLFTPPQNLLTSDAIKRLDAIQATEDLGAGFTLATHDLEIRGAGELLGEEQSGHMNEIGFSLYCEFLEKTVEAMRSGKNLDVNQPLRDQTEIDLHIPALIPENYLPDVHSRLILYKRIANAKDEEGLRELQVEMIDRFGLLPDASKNLFEIANLKLRAKILGIKKIDVNKDYGIIEFDAQPKINVTTLIKLIQTQPKHFQLMGGTEKLKFNINNNETANRINIVSDLLTLLSKP